MHHTRGFRQQDSKVLTLSVMSALQCGEESSRLTAATQPLSQAHIRAVEPSYTHTHQRLHYMHTQLALISTSLILSMIVCTDTIVISTMKLMAAMRGFKCKMEKL